MCGSGGCCSPHEHHAVCHTDFAIQSGQFPSPFPTVVGHEGSGTVISVGVAVTKVQAGDSVLLSFSYCGNCGSCKTDYPAGCEQFGEVNFGRACIHLSIGSSEWQG